MDTETVKLLRDIENSICNKIGKLHQRFDDEIKSNQEVKTNLDNHFQNHERLETKINLFTERSRKNDSYITVHLRNHRVYRRIIGTIGSILTTFATIYLRYFYVG